MLICMYYKVACNLKWTNKNGLLEERFFSGESSACHLWSSLSLFLSCIVIVSSNNNNPMLHQARMFSSSSPMHILSTSTFCFFFPWRWNFLHLSKGEKKIKKTDGTSLVGFFSSSFRRVFYSNQKFLAWWCGFSFSFGFLLFLFEK